MRYIRPHQDLSPDICHEKPSVKSSAIYLASAIHLHHVETHPSLRSRILLSFVFSKILWESVHASPDGYNLPSAVSCTTSSLFCWVSLSMIIRPLHLSLSDLGTHSIQGKLPESKSSGFWQTTSSPRYSFSTSRLTNFSS